MLTKNKPFMAAYDNNLDAFIPEQWANESIAILAENMVAANLVHRDFEMEFAKKGDTVNTRQPAHMTAKRKGRHDSVVVQDITATNVPVVLDQHVYTTFLIEDGDETMAFKDLTEIYIRPAAIALANHADRIVLGQYPQFLPNMYGALGGLTVNNAVEYIVGTGKIMNDNLAHMSGRNLVLGTGAHALAIQNSVFHEADKVGDMGTALREASLGRKLGFDTFMDQNMVSMPTDTTLGSGKVNNGSGYPVGTTTLTIDDVAMGELLAGQWISLEGRPYHVTAVNADPATTMTLEGGLKYAVANDDDFTIFDSGAVNQPSGSPDGYPAGYAKEIVVDGFTGTPINRGQIITFGTSNVKYVVVETNGSTEVLLDRPLAEAIGDGDAVNLGPTGGFNLAFHRNAMTLAIRPLALPKQGAGAIGGLASFGGLTVRTTVAYDPYRQGHLVTMDFLAGIKVLDTDLGAILLS